jgi:hypothetical protein
MNHNLLIVLLTTFGLPAVASIIAFSVARLMPKEKAVESGRSFGNKIGEWLDNIGNSKIGKKAMDTLEEGPISTGCRYLIAVVEGILESLDHDEVKLSVEKKINTDITKAFDEAMRKE